MSRAHDFPENHPVKTFFRRLAGRALTQSSLSDKDLLLYLTDLLIDFIYIENFYRLKDGRNKRLEYLVDMVQAAVVVPQRKKKAYYKQIGDYTLFILGMFPESLACGRRMLPHSFYADTGRRSYIVASELEADVEITVVLRKVAEKYERCVLSLNWVREYTSDPFFQYMLRQFGVT